MTSTKKTSTKKTSTKKTSTKKTSTKKTTAKKQQQKKPSPKKSPAKKTKTARDIPTIDETTNELKNSLPEFKTTNLLLSLSSVTQDRRLQFGAMDNALVDLYAEFLQNGAVFPPIKVIYDANEENYHIIDGNHRYHAHLKEFGPDGSIICTLYEGDPAKEGVWLATAANRETQKVRTNKEKHAIAVAAIRSPLAESLSLEALALHCGLSHTYLYKVKDELDNPETPAVQDTDNDETQKKYKVSTEIFFDDGDIDYYKTADKLAKSVLKANDKMGDDNIAHRIVYKKFAKTIVDVLGMRAKENLLNNIISAEIVVKDGVVDYEATAVNLALSVNELKASMIYNSEITELDPYLIFSEAESRTKGD